MAIRTYYDVLGVPRSASAAQIQSNFRRLAMQWHPDRNRRADAPARFREINEAYQCLRDPASRRDYDAAIRAAESGAGEHGSDAGGGARRRGPRPADPWSELNARLNLRPDMLIAVFTSVDVWFRRVFAQSRRRADPQP